MRKILPVPKQKGRAKRTRAAAEVQADAEDPPGATDGK